MDPLVSIIIPTYNSRLWLGEAIDSALAQTYPHCEIVVVDDGSSDGTGTWLRERYSDSIRYFHQSNRGLAAARNTGLKHASGKYIQFLDADDLLHPNKVAFHVEYLERHPDVAIAYSHCLCFPDGRPEELFEWDRKHLYRSGNVFESLLGRGYLLIHMPLSSRKWLDKAGLFDERLWWAADREYWLRVAWAGADFQYLDGEPLVLYRVRLDSLSHALDHARMDLDVQIGVRRYVTDPAEQRRLRLGRAVGGSRFAYGRVLAEHGRLAAGFWQMVRAVWADRRDLDYKLAFMLMSVLVGPARSGRLLVWLKRAKASVLARLLGSEGARKRTRS